MSPDSSAQAFAMTDTSLTLPPERATLLACLVAEGEDWLMERTLAYAKRHEYTRYTSTLAEAWRASIRGLSAPLLDCLRQPRPAIAPVDALHTHQDDVAGAFGLAEARKHRSRGVSLGLFLGLMKYYRRAYVDRVMEADLPGPREDLRLFVETFFDRVEVTFASEWAERGEADKMEELREGSRRIINEKNRYLTIFESVNEPVVVLDEAGAVVAVNHAASSLFAGTDVPGAFYYSGRAPQWLDPAMASILADTAARPPTETELVTARGKRWFEVKVESMLDVSRKFEGTVFIFSDVTLRKQAETQLEQSRMVLEGLVAERTADLAAANADLRRMVDALTRSNEDLERFAYIASHDLQEPLRSISGFAQLLASRYKGKLDTDADEFIGFMVEGVKRMSALISDLLTYSRVGARAEPAQAVAAGEALQAARELLTALIEETGTDISVAPLPMVMADRVQLAQLLQNLLTNAIKFRPPGRRPQIAITATCKDGWAHFAVSDNGIGIPPEHRDEVFLPFRRLHAHYQYPGTGIGLAVAKRIVERHGGAIAAEEGPDGGTRIVFTLPLAEEGATP